MNRQTYDGRFLVSMTGAIIRQDTLRPVRGGMDWERMYRLADYHKVANMVYLGLLGNGGQITGRWKELFFERYLQGLSFAEHSDETERELLTLIDMNQVPCVVLESSRISNIYPIPEMAYQNPLRVLLGKENYSLIKGQLVDLGYVTDTFYEGYGERMVHSNGFRIEIYYALPFRTHFYNRQMKELISFAYVKSPFKYVRGLSIDGQFVWIMAQNIYRYVTDDLKIRDVMDLYLYHKKWTEHLNQEYIDRALAAFHIEEIADKLLALSYLWFGDVQELPAKKRMRNPEVYDILEARILSRVVMADAETDQQAQALAELIYKELQKEKRAERKAERKKITAERKAYISKKLKWLFPEYKYMESMYPRLHYIPVLLPFYWGARLLRLFRLSHASDEEEE